MSPPYPALPTIIDLAMHIPIPQCTIPPAPCYYPPGIPEHDLLVIPMRRLEVHAVPWVGQQRLDHGGACVEVLEHLKERGDSERGLEVGRSSIPGSNLSWRWPKICMSVRYTGVEEISN